MKKRSIRIHVDTKDGDTYMSTNYLVGEIEHNMIIETVNNLGGLSSSFMILCETSAGKIRHYIPPEIMKTSVVTIFDFGEVEL